MASWHKYTSVTTQIIWIISNHTVFTLTKTSTVYLHQKLKQFDPYKHKHNKHTDLL